MDWTTDEEEESFDFVDHADTVKKYYAHKYMKQIRPLNRVFSCKTLFVTIYKSEK